MLEEVQKKVVSTDAVQSTADYTIFKQLSGNRPVDKAHAKQLMKNMLNVGNLTAEFPITVNENMEVIDGQHRLQALKELGWPVGYRIHEGLTLDTVRGINQAGRNWNWRDYAHSYAQHGTPEQKEQYQRFLNLENHFHYPFNILMKYIGVRIDRRGGTGFRDGELRILDQKRTFKLLKQYQEITEILGHGTTKFAKAMYRIMRDAEGTYSHEHMVHKAKIWEQEIKQQGSIDDYLRLIEQIYNYRTAQENRIRLY